MCASAGSFVAALLFDPQSAYSKCGMFEQNACF